LTVRYNDEIVYSGSIELTTTTYHDEINNVFIPRNIDQSYNLKYVEIPLSLKLRTNEIGYLTYYGNFGFRTA